MSDNAVDSTAAPASESPPPPLTKPELLAPAGSPESFYAAMSYGADAVYLGLKKFSARDNAVNFSEDDLDHAVGHAHALGRKVYVAINTVVQESEWPELLGSLAFCEEIGVDAIILQDMGVMRAIREYFPRLKWHASTQMLIHNVEGARWAERNGFERAILARELTLDEIRDIRTRVNIELETFIHGSLCYSYSGLCLFASQEEGRSGNRGKCTYICRDNFQSSTGDGKAFSMKDLFAPTEVGELCRIGVHSLKIEGRRKAPLYVACVTDLYRRLIDGEEVDIEEYKRRLKLIYARETTSLFLHQSHGDTKVQADIHESESNGVYLGSVERVQDGRAHFRAATPFERHDGILARSRDNGNEGVRFGADRINLFGNRVFKAAAGDEVSLPVPDGVAKGHELRLVSSNEIKRMYPTRVPAKPEHARIPVHLDISLRIDRDGGRLSELGMPGLIEITGRVYNLEIRREYPCKLLFADRHPLDEERLRGFFERLGNTRFELRTFGAIIPAGVFIPAAEVNESRRRYFETLDQEVRNMRSRNRELAVEAVMRAPRRSDAPPPPRSFSALVDRTEYLEALPMERLEEVTLDVANGTLESVMTAWEQWGDKLRIGVPTIARAWNTPMLRAKLKALFDAGARRFRVANLGGLEFVAAISRADEAPAVDTLHILRRSPSVSPRAGVAIYEPQVPDFTARGLDIASDWPCYVMSRETARSWLEQGLSRVTLSVEDGIENLKPLLRDYGALAEVVVYQNTPLFTGETCVHANLLGHCPGKARCDFTSTELTAPDGNKYLAVDHWCRTIILNTRPFAWTHRVKELEAAGAGRFRLDFIHRNYNPEELNEICQTALNQKPIPETHEGNWQRGLQ
jgi:U32 family peptidase